jgi:hypothetical protein
MIYIFKIKHCKQQYTEKNVTAPLASLSREATQRTRTLATAAASLHHFPPRRRLNGLPASRAACGDGGGVAPLLLSGGSRRSRPSGLPGDAHRRGPHTWRRRLVLPDPVLPRPNPVAARLERASVRGVRWQSALGAATTATAGADGPGGGCCRCGYTATAAGAGV